MSRLGRDLRRGLLLVVLAGLHLSVAAEATRSEAVEVKGLVASPASFAVGDLEQMQVREVVLAAEHGAKRTYRGVLLRDLLSASKPIETTRFDLRRNYVVARATDGYLAVFSWIELFDSPLGNQVLVAFDVDGAPLADAEGRIALVSGGDTHSGPRHVRWLSSIDVRRAT